MSLEVSIVNNEQYHAHLRRRAEGLPACIGELLTPRALAYGVSDNVSHNKGRGFFLHTNSYSISEGELLSSLLNDKFGFSSVV